jgi:hypothetical protein
MKKILSLFGILALVATMITSAQAQSPTYAAQTLGTYVASGSTASNVAYVIDVRKQAGVALQWDNQMSTSATDAQTIYISRSVDGSTYSTTVQLVTLTPVASTASTITTNILSQGAGYLKINYGTNAAASAVSTNTLKYGIKISAP